MCSSDLATDSARVLRLPGFYNHKYSQPYRVRAEILATETYRPENFPKLGEDRASSGREREGARVGRTIAGRPLSQSERDWAFAKRALARGESPEMVAAAIASSRRFDKSDPQYYADLSVRKAQQALQGERDRAEQERT